MLSELAELAMEAARTAKEEVKADPAQGAIAFGRAARAVRLTLMLQARLIQALEARDNPTADTAGRHERPTWIERIIVDAAERDGAERLVREGLDREDLHDDLPMDRVGDLAALIRRDLGVDPDGLTEQAQAERTGAGGWVMSPDTPGDPLPDIIQGRFRPSG